eukprot:TRINITY_DN14361_c0_g1_i2.p1 TRINITY_DN14361_c0_g1~~TRINITY_DN14361_c0_g1_i2.p1  ORF type:complete len:369 (+),score=32.65 TRINITY_DN14361_c0_g1_i2:76-1107(+)
MAAAVVSTLERATKQLGFCLRSLKTTNAIAVHQRNLSGALQTLLAARHALTSLNTNSVVTLDLASSLHLKAPAVPVTPPEQAATSRTHTPRRTRSSSPRSATPSRTQATSLRKSTPSRTEVSSSRSASPSCAQITSLRNTTPCRIEVSSSRNTSPSSARETLLRNTTPSRTEVTPLRNTTPSRTKVSLLSPHCTCYARMDARGAYQKLLARWMSRGQSSEAELGKFLEKKSHLPGCEGQKARLVLEVHAQAQNTGKPRKFLRAKRHLPTVSPGGVAETTGTSFVNVDVPIIDADNADSAYPKKKTDQQTEEDGNALLDARGITLRQYVFKKTSQAVFFPPLPA